MVYQRYYGQTIEVVHAIIKYRSISVFPFTTVG